MAKEQEEVPAGLGPLSFISGGNTGITYAELQRRRAIATALASRQKKFPTNVGEGLTYLGESIGEAAQGWQASAAERAMGQAESAARAGSPADTTYTPAVSADPAVSTATPVLPTITDVKTRPVTAAEAEVANQPAQTGPAPVGAPVPDPTMFDPTLAPQQRPPMQRPILMPPGTPGRGGIGHAAAPAGVQVASAATGTMSDALPPEATQVAALTPPGTPAPGVFDAPAKLPANAPRSFVPTGEPTQAEATANRIVGGQDMTGVDPRLMDIMKAAARGLPPGYTVQPTSGVREGGGGYHPKGVASDWQIIDPQGRAIPNRGPDSTGLYTQLAQSAYSYQNTKHPNLTGSFNWGGAFGTSGANPNEPDLMHFDLGGDRGRIGQYRRSEIYGPPDGGAPVGSFATANAAGAPAARGGSYNDPRGLIPYIREAAVARGIDPDVAVRVASTEGLNTFQSSVVKNGQREPSWGAYQLYTGGGLGNKFQQATGLDPSDPKNERATIDFALDQAKQGGWGPWYGAKGAGIGQWQGIDGKRSSLENPRDAVTAALVAQQQQPDPLADVAGTRPRPASYAPTAGLGGSGGVGSDAPPVTGMGSAANAGIARAMGAQPQIIAKAPEDPVTPPPQQVAQARSSVITDAGPIKMIPGSSAPVIGAMPAGATVQPPAATGNAAIGKVPVTERPVPEAEDVAYPKPRAEKPPPTLIKPSDYETYQRGLANNPRFSPEFRKEADAKADAAEKIRFEQMRRQQEAWKNDREAREQEVRGQQDYERKYPDRVLERRIKQLAIDEAMNKAAGRPVEAAKARADLDIARENLSKLQHERERLRPIEERRSAATATKAEQEVEAGKLPPSFSEHESKQLKYYQRSTLANRQLGDGRALMNKDDHVLTAGAPYALSNMGVSEPYQIAVSAANSWIESVLRDASGAVIRPEEYSDYRRQYFPQPGDGEKIIAQKEQRRRVAEGSVYDTLGKAKGKADEFRARLEGGEYDVIPDGTIQQNSSGKKRVRRGGKWEELPDGQ